MFCPKCGNQVGENEKFCGKCGEPLQNAAPQQVQPQQESPYAARSWPQQQNAQQQYQQQYQQQPYAQYQQAPAANPKAAGTLKILYLVVVVTGLLSAFLWFGKGIYASAMGFQQTGSFHEMCADGGEILSVLNVIFGILIAVLCLLPILTNSAAKRKRLIGTKILAILQLLVVAIVLIATEGQASGSYGGMISWGLTGLGYIQVITVLANLVIPYIISSKSKKL